MTFSEKNRAIFEKRRKQRRIVFHDVLPPDKWPSNHREVFEKIEKAKQFKYSTYAAAQDELDNSPWKGDAKMQARKLVVAAKDCISRNESTWRHACESLVFSRLFAEVACKNCRKRVWRSEIETSAGGEANSIAANLRYRQQTRDRCRCPRRTRPGDEDERIGLNKLFISRAEDQVRHPSDSALELPQEQRPDRIFGLRQTRNLESMLLKEIGHDRFLEDELHEQPHSNNSGEALLFPFLVVEAKAGNAPDDWSSIRLQTAFPIYTYLNTQQSLRSATAQKSKWKSGPLVWFFMSRGEDWRLCLAYQVPHASNHQPSNNTHHTTEIVQVWAGSITNRDDALQLFLIVDFMSDWARDTYRQGVLTELRTLASVDADLPTVFTDTDIYSSGGVLPIPSSVDEIGESQTDGGDIQVTFRSYDNRLGSVRHIRPIKSRFMSFFLTADNIRTFISSLQRNIRTLVIRRLLDQFHSYTQTACLLTLDCLNRIEEIWTGHSRSCASFSLRGTRFYTVHLVTYYLSASWEQIRELCVITVAEDAFEILISESQLKVGKGKAKTPTVVNDQDSLDVINSNLLSLLSEIRGAPARQNLLACISRISHYIDPTADEFKAGPAVVWELVSYAYKYHKKGDLEPDLPFLHISDSCEVQVDDADDQRESEHDNMSSIASEDVSYTTNSNHDRRCPLLIGRLRVSDEGAVLVHGGASQSVQGRSSSSLCVYIVDGPTELPNKARLAKIIKRTFEDCDVYHTTRDNGTLNLRTERSYRDIWNLAKPYGVFFSYGGRSFIKWLEALEMPLPTRQGSPRGRVDSGRSIFSREYWPWHDPRLNHGGPFALRKKRFLKTLFQFEVEAWAGIAEKKVREGTVCCALCAREDNDSIYKAYGWISGLCGDCQTDLNPKDGINWPYWLKTFIRRTLERTRLRFSATPAPLEPVTSPNGYSIRTPSPLQILQYGDGTSRSEYSEDSDGSDFDVTPGAADEEDDGSIDEFSETGNTPRNTMETRNLTSSSDISGSGDLAEGGSSYRQEDNPSTPATGSRKRKRQRFQEEQREMDVIRRI